jgi:hypothetical protein
MDTDALTPMLRTASLSEHFLTKDIHVQVPCPTAGSDGAG